MKKIFLIDNYDSFTYNLQFYLKELGCDVTVKRNDLFEISFPKSFKNENKIGSSCLTVMVKRGNEVNFEYSKGQVIEKINSFFGYDAIQNIKLVSFEVKNEQFKEKQSLNDVTKNKYKKQISDIKNDKIKNSLLELSKVYKKK